MKKAVVLLSGGVDSATVLAIARDQGFECYALSIRYGQRHAIELDAAERVAGAMDVAGHSVVELDLTGWGGSALTDSIDVPKDRVLTADDIPVTYVPARNTILLSLALSWAETLGAYDIFIGANAIDYSGYPDCRPEFIRAFEKLAAKATKAGVEGHRFIVHAPLIELSKKEIIQRGSRLGVDYGLTHSCYDPREDGAACGECDSCRLRIKGFEEAGLHDPILYA